MSQMIICLSCLLSIFILATLAVRSEGFVSGKLVPTFVRSDNTVRRLTMAIQSVDEKEAVILSLDDTNSKRILKGDLPVLVDVCAQWCGPCKLIEPVLARCAQQHKDNLIVTRFDIDAEAPNLKFEFLLQEVMPRSLPSLILFQEQRAVAVHNGVISDQQLADFLESNLVSRNAKPEEEVIVEAQRIHTSGFVSLAGSLAVDDYMVSQAL